MSDTQLQIKETFRTRFLSTIRASVPADFISSERLALCTGQSTHPALFVGKINIGS
jgi:hypothetical protein